MNVLIFPFPDRTVVNAESYDTVDLNKLLRSSTTYGLTAAGADEDADIYPGDLLIVDRALVPLAGDVVITMRTGNFIVKLYDGGQVWGVVTHTIRSRR